MKIKSNFASLLLCVFALIPVAGRAQTNNLAVLLQSGLFEEQANRNLDAAIASYQSLATQFDKDRQLAATAVFRLGECYRALGKTNEAAAQYQRVLRDFSDEQTLATLSRQNLTGMGVAAPKSFTERGTTVVTSQRTRELELVKKLQAMPLSEIRQVAPTFLTDGTLINLINQYNQCELDLVRLRVDYAEENPQVKRTVVIRDEMGKKIMERLEGLSHAISLDLAASENVTDTSAESNSKPVTDEEESEIVRIQQMIQNSPDLINARVDGSTPLAKAASNGWLKVAAYLLDHGADVNVGAPLNVAAAAGNRAMVELLLSRGANVNSLENGRTPLIIASEKNYPSVIEVLLANKADVNLPLGNAPLSRSAAIGNEKIVKLLLAAGANPNVEDFLGVTPLAAAAAGSPESVKLLLAAKADPNGGKLDAPLFCAIYKHDTASAELLLQAEANPNMAGRINFPSQPPSSVIGYYLSQPGGGRMGGLGGSTRSVTPLGFAVSEGQLPMVQLLLKFKADPNDSQTDGKPLLFSALTDTNILESLLDAGAKVDVMGVSENVRVGEIWIHLTPLEEAARLNNAAAVEILLKHGANPNVRDPIGNYTPLHWAADFLADRKVFELLLAYKAERNVRNTSGQTPLDILKQKTKADDQTTDSSGKVRAGELADLLRQHGALDKLPDWDRITVSRPAANFSQAVFQKSTNDWNQVSLFDLLGVQYRLITPLNNQERYDASPYNRSDMAIHNSLPFPDFSGVIIHHPTADGKNWGTRKVDLARILNSGDCNGDVLLQWGDVVEIPEADHVINQQWQGLSTNELMTLKNCLTRHLQITVNGQTANFVVSPQVEIQTLSEGAMPVNANFVGKTHVVAQLITDEPFMLWPVLNESKKLLSSSDLSRVKVVRRDAKRGKTHEWIVDCSDQQSPSSPMARLLQARAADMNGSQPNNFQPSSDLWLRDGDVIEVPEKP